MFSRNGVGFTVILNPASVWDPVKGAYRTSLLIHPARSNGTQGCIGLLGDQVDLLEVANNIENYLINNQNSIDVYVEYYEKK